MYPYGCKSTTTTAYLTLKKSGSAIISWTASDSSIFSPVTGTLKGTYTLEVTTNWTAIDVPDYTVRVVGSSALSITGGAKTSASH